MSIGLEVIVIFCSGALLFGIAALSLKARQRTLNRRTQLQERRKFRERNAKISERWV
jgi:hypothetical protein